MGKSEADKNKAAFDNLYSHKTEIEKELGISLKWERADQYKASWISYTLTDVSIGNEADWPRMAKFHAVWSERICETMLPYLQEDEEDDNARLMQIAGVLRDRTVSREDVNEDLAKCNRTLTRFTTDEMTAILPDIPGAPSGWNTDNHYFYEIVNRTGNSVYIQFVISSKNITDEYRKICDRINELYPARRRNWDWVWRTHFKTSIFTFSEELSRDEIFAGLDGCFSEIRKFEAELQERLGSGIVTADSDGEEFYLSVGDADAKCRITQTGVVLLKGARINAYTNRNSLNDGQAKLRDKIIAEGKVQELVTQEDIRFSSSSAAADFVLGYSVSGPATWKDSAGHSLKELESKATD